MCCEKLNTFKVQNVLGISVVPFAVLAALKFLACRLVFGR